MDQTPTAEERAKLRVVLKERFPWLRDTEVGPCAVEAGECDRCGREARLVAVCGPTPWEAIGRRCANELGTDGWCAGHRDDAQRYLAALAALPAEADVVARMWWIASGEVRQIAGLPDINQLDRGN